MEDKAVKDKQGRFSPTLIGGGTDWWAQVKIASSGHQGRQGIDRRVCFSDFHCSGGDKKGRKSTRYSPGMRVAWCPYDGLNLR
jgi:hypothetical protein